MQVGTSLTCSGSGLESLFHSLYCCCTGRDAGGDLTCGGSGLVLRFHSLYCCCTGRDAGGDLTYLWWFWSSVAFSQPALSLHRASEVPTCISQVGTSLTCGSSGLVLCFHSLYCCCTGQNTGGILIIIGSRTQKCMGCTSKTDAVLVFYLAYLHLSLASFFIYKN